MCTGSIEIYHAASAMVCVSKVVQWVICLKGGHFVSVKAEESLWVISLLNNDCTYPLFVIVMNFGIVKESCLTQIRTVDIDFHKLILQQEPTVQSEEEQCDNNNDTYNNIPNYNVYEPNGTQGIFFRLATTSPSLPPPLI